MSQRAQPATPSGRQPVNKGILGWVERQIILFQDDPERAARAVRSGYWVSVGFLLLGYAIILTTLFRLDTPAAPYLAVGLGIALLFWGSYAWATRRARRPKRPA